MWRPPDCVCWKNLSCNIHISICIYDNIIFSHLRTAEIRLYSNQWELTDRIPRLFVIYHILWSTLDDIKAYFLCRCLHRVNYGTGSCVWRHRVQLYSTICTHDVYCDASADRLLMLIWFQDGFSQQSLTSIAEPADHCFCPSLNVSTLLL